MRFLPAIRRQAVPLGLVLAVTATALIGTAAPAHAATSNLTLSANSGPSGGGNSIIATSDATPFTAGATFLEFQYRAASGANASCASTYQAAASITTSGGVVPVSTVTITDTAHVTFTVPGDLALVGTQTSALYNLCGYDATTGTTHLIADTDTAGGYTIYGQRLTLNTYQGPSGGTNTITATTAGGSFSAGIAVEFQYVTTDPTTAYCATSYQTGVTPNGTVGIVPAPASNVLSATKAAVTVPSGLALAGVQTSAPYNLCVYDGTGSGNALIAGTFTPYVIAVAATISTVTPSAGPAQGGSTITVTGAHFPQSLTAMLAGQSLTNISVASNGQSFTATVPAHAAGGPFNLLVTTPAGTVSKAGVFTYTNGITVSPNTTPNTSLNRTWIDVHGIGFNDLPLTGVTGSNTTGSASNGAGAHVYLVRGAYDPKSTTTGGATKTNGQIIECVDVAVIDDTELVCGLYPAGNQASIGSSRTVTGCTSTGTTLAGGTSSTTCTFTSADVGMAVTGSTIATGTVITAVSGPTTATLSKAPTVAILATAVLTVSPARTITDAGTNGTTTLTSATGFSSAEIGHSVNGPGIPAGDTIASLGSGTPPTTAILAVAATATQTNATMQIFIPSPVPIGTYTITVVSNGSVNAQAVAGYSQSIISSGSTFTVADYLR